MKWLYFIFPEKHSWLFLNKQELLEKISLFQNKKNESTDHWYLLSYDRQELKALLYIFKKRPQPILRKVFCRLLSDRLKEEIAEENIWRKGKIYLVPIPKYQKWYQKKYNQAEILAYDIAKNLDLIYYPILKKIKPTEKQAKLKRKERLENLQNAFSCQEKIDQLGLYIIIDDIKTTGATIKEARRALKFAGAKKIWSITLFG